LEAQQKMQGLATIVWRPSHGGGQFPVTWVKVLVVTALVQKVSYDEK